jgi:hypothetical protein
MLLGVSALDFLAAEVGCHSLLFSHWMAWCICCLTSKSALLFSIIGGFILLFSPCYLVIGWLGAFAV